MFGLTCAMCSRHGVYIYSCSRADVSRSSVRVEQNRERSTSASNSPVLETRCIDLREERERSTREEEGT